MMNQKIKLFLALAIAGLVLVLFAPVPAVFLGLLLGLLVLPPVVALSITMVEGSSRLSTEVKKTLEKEKRDVVISMKPVSP